MPLLYCKRFSSRVIRAAAYFGAAALLTAALSGCRSAQVAQPVTEKLAGNDPDTQLEFWHVLATRPITSNDEAFHGLLLYLNQQDAARDYDGRVAALKERKMLAAHFNRPAHEAVSRGTLAVAIVRALQIKGGLTMRLAGPTPRYATRELMFMDLYPVSSPNQTFSGTEFLGIIGRMEDYQRGNAAQVPAAVLPGEMESSAQRQPAAVSASQPAAPAR